MLPILGEDWSMLVGWWSWAPTIAGLGLCSVAQVASASHTLRHIEESTWEPYC